MVVQPLGIRKNSKNVIVSNPMETHNSI